MRCNPRSLLFLVAALLIGAPLHANAQAAPLEGTFVYAADASDDINQAIEQGVAKMNFITRPVARGRLKKTNTPYRTVMIAHTPEQVRVTLDDRVPIVTPANGTPIQWRREDGENLNVSTEWENGRLEQTFKAEDGQRVNVFTLSPDGNTMTVNVTVSSPRLPGPVTYDLVYRRRQ